MEKLSDMSGRNISRVHESRNSGGLGVGDLLSTKKHEPLDASHGAQIIAKEFQQENERLKEEVAILEVQCNAKDEKIAYCEEIVSAKDKEIADLKEKLSELQQNRQEKEVDFAKQLKTTDEELGKIPFEEQLFNAKDYFDPQPSWFDTMSPSNIRCLEINNYPVRANNLYSKNTVKCNCDGLGSTKTSYQSFGEQCVCRPNVIGRACDICQSGYSGFRTVEN